jgi:hypothetical protein
LKQWNVVYIFIYGLFNDAFSISDFKALNGRVISAKGSGNIVKGIGLGLITGTLPAFDLRG